MPDYTLDRTLFTIEVSFCYFWGNECEHLRFIHHSRGKWDVVLGTASKVLIADWDGTPSQEEANKIMDHHIASLQETLQGDESIYKCGEHDAPVDYVTIASNNLEIGRE